MKLYRTTNNKVYLKNALLDVFMSLCIVITTLTNQYTKASKNLVVINVLINKDDCMLTVWLKNDHVVKTTYVNRFS